MSLEGLQVDYGGKFPERPMTSQHTQEKKCCEKCQYYMGHPDKTVSKLCDNPSCKCHTQENNWREDDSPYRTALSHAMTFGLDALMGRKDENEFADELVQARNAVDREVANLIATSNDALIEKATKQIEVCPWKVEAKEQQKNYLSKRDKNYVMGLEDAARILRSYLSTTNKDREV